jgi:hypothetical protein
MKIISSLVITFLFASSLPAQWSYLSSLHRQRAGFNNAYSAINNGMEIITGIPYEQLSCKQCHSITGLFANGSLIDPVTYNPNCLDCHNFQNGFVVEEVACLNCHQRQLREHELYPSEDVHANEGLTCISCHSKEELHGDDNISYLSLKETGAVKADCTNCHTQLNNNPSHNRHLGKVDCSACHAVSVYSCGGCHFESYIATAKMRFNNEFNNYRLLVKKDGLVKLGAIVTHSYNGKTNYIISSTHSHIIKRSATTCNDCHLRMGHSNEIIQEYNNTGFITVAKWNEITKQVEIRNGVIPLVEDWRQSFKIDHSNYSGDSSVFPTDPNLWQYLKSETDNAHLYFADPLDSSTLEKLGISRFPTDVYENNIPAEFKLYQNYPNPFNPNTKIRWQTSVGSHQTLKIYNILGTEVATLVDEYRPAGSYEAYFDASNHSSGVYLYRLQSGGNIVTKKMILLK